MRVSWAANKTSQLYIVKEGAGGPIKVGRSDNARSRIASLQTGNPRALSLIGAWELPYDLVLEAERMLLDELSRWSLSGEWLDLDENFIVDYLPDFFLSNGYEPTRVA